MSLRRTAKARATGGNPSQTRAILTVLLSVNHTQGELRLRPSVPLPGLADHAFKIAPSSAAAVAQRLAPSQSRRSHLDDRRRVEVRAGLLGAARQPKRRDRARHRSAAARSPDVLVAWQRRSSPAQSLERPPLQLRRPCTFGPIRCRAPTASGVATRRFSATCWRPPPPSTLWAPPAPAAPANRLPRLCAPP